MATSAPGPVPVPPMNQANLASARGHSRQPSSSQRPTTRGDPSASRAPRNPTTTTTNTTQAEIRPSTGAAPIRVQLNTGSSQRPATSHGAQSGAQGASGASGLGRSRTVRQPNATTAAQPQQTETAQPQTAGNPPLNASAAPSTNNETQITRSSFPHAFERWEMLSARWEGLTGYWVSRLEGNRQELSHLPLEQEMSRQITDLAAAGANLFQALIELQRLRASSERKFQRWFFETRADQERAREMSSELERTLRVERQKRADALTAMQQCEKDKATAEKLAQEAQRELTISKEECRRAWEELGRREQEERERINQLREGHPTLIGGVQVIAMPMPGVPSRSGSTAARPRTATGATGSTTAFSNPQNDPYVDPPRESQTSPSATRSRQTGPQQTAQSDYTTRPPILSHETDFSDIQQAADRETTPTGTRSPQQNPQSAASPTSFYQQPPTGIHERLGPNERQSASSPVPSYVTNPMASPTISAVSGISDAFVTDEHGNVVTDGHGNPIYANRSRRHDFSRLDEPLADDQRSWQHYPSYEGEDWDQEGASNVAVGAVDDDERDYDTPQETGGVGIPPTNITYRTDTHHHPTRLSNIEEERETASEAGRP